MTGILGSSVPHGPITSVLLAPVLGLLSFHLYSWRRMLERRKRWNLSNIQNKNQIVELFLYVTKSIIVTPFLRLRWPILTPLKTMKFNCALTYTISSMTMFWHIWRLTILLGRLKWFQMWILRISSQLLSEQLNAFSFIAKRLSRDSNLCLYMIGLCLLCLWMSLTRYGIEWASLTWTHTKRNGNQTWNISKTLFRWFDKLWMLLSTPRWVSWRMYGQMCGRMKVW